MLKIFSQNVYVKPLLFSETKPPAKGSKYYRNTYKRNLRLPRWMLIKKNNFRQNAFAVKLKHFLTPPYICTVSFTGLNKW